ncbi:MULTISPECIES: hypothetical protein [Bacillaceae]|uniref:Uncharacterized protein n=1 Tax=Gottfriedia luciferensis TaxID=178774 RepID=A0ABX2ZVG3_9BACI|nr:MULTISPECIES: hypothetical protein [Bacillaceae]ODG93364.1 hypothetical protein BED47_03485 [Gottfriedia luciferensis]PGZ94980.1 hypothetical protein COE53_00020 [Bacillus sp. AFS029533]SFC49222.1 hypothetical protein SAMN02799633_00983 [Bacillus sp. UNCCL81]
MVAQSHYFTFGAEMGDPYASDAVSPKLIQLRKLLVQHCNKIYCKEIDEIAPILRVDGMYSDFNFEGYEKLRLSKKFRYITIDVGMPQSKWENKTDTEIKEYLIVNLKSALEAMVKCLKKEKYGLNETDLWEDFCKVEKQFLCN